MRKYEDHGGYWQNTWKQFKRHRLGHIALVIVILFCLIGIYAPILASSKPLIVYFNGVWYFPLFRYLFYSGFFTKNLDLFYNLLMFTTPLMILTGYTCRSNPRKCFGILGIILILHLLIFGYLIYRPLLDPAASPLLNQKRQERIQSNFILQQGNPFLNSPSWDEDLGDMTPYDKLNLILRYQQQKKEHTRLLVYQQAYAHDAQKRGITAKLPTLWQIDYDHRQAKEQQLKKNLENDQATYPQAKAKLIYLEQKYTWLEKESQNLKYEMMPLIRPYHWEDDAGGGQLLNQYTSWWNLTRINRKDMVAALIFGIRISLSVGLLAVGLALLISIPIGSIAGFYGGKIDILIYRLIEIWESMPTFFMLLMIVAFLQSKSIFLVIAVIGLFGWTGFSRFIRGEFFKQKQLPYVEACRALGFSNRYIMFSHLLPNAIPPLLTLVPFAIMGAITSEAGLSFLGLGEEGSCSWGVLMDEGRTAFPAESQLLWPPAILLTILLVTIALVGDALRDALDPKLR